ncbi:MAG: hypothetical protein QOH35_2624 [Acidobacteriaceae bacterium]|nr:hypothetical protein [Acidobacteriaceae bacterium]
MQRQCVSKLTRMATHVMIACALAGISSSVWAANDNRGDRDREKHCSNRTLDGNYGFTVEGLLGIPGSGIQVRGVLLQEYDGNGHLTRSSMWSSTASRHPRRGHPAAALLP